MKELAVVVLTVFIWYYGCFRFLPWAVPKIFDWFYDHSEGQQTEIEIQIVVSIVALCVLILLFG